MGLWWCDHLKWEIIYYQLSETFWLRQSQWLRLATVDDSWCYPKPWQGAKACDYNSNWNVTAGRLRWAVIITDHDCIHGCWAIAGLTMTKDRNRRYSWNWGTHRDHDSRQRTVTVTIIGREWLTATVLIWDGNVPTSRDRLPIMLMASPFPSTPRMMKERATNVMPVVYFNNLGNSMRWTTGYKIMLHSW